MTDNSRIYWCPQCDVPLLSTTCDICGAKGFDCASDLRPVFSEEREMLSRFLGVELPEGIFYNMRRIVHRGKTYLWFTVDADGNLAIRYDKRAEFDQINNESFEEHIQRTVSANEIFLNNLTKSAYKFIRDRYSDWEDRIDDVTVAFSGGKDSIVVADLVRRALKSKGVTPTLFFADTTLELPDTYIFIEQLGGMGKIVRTSPDVDFFELCDVLDPPSKMMRWCCTVLKAASANKMILRYDGDVLNFDGIRKAESRSRSKYPPVRRNPKVPRQITARPILDWSSLAVWLYIFWRKLPINEAYKKGFSRVGCGICPFNSTYDDFILQHQYANHRDKESPEWALWKQRWDRFVAIVRQFAIDNDKKDPDDFFLKGYWKMRKPGRGQETLVTVVESNNHRVFRFTEPMPEYVYEFLKPFSKMITSSTSSYFRSCQQEAGTAFISGYQNGQELIVTSLDGNKTLDLVERQVLRAINCVGCGSCVTSCPCRAIELKNGSIAIDQEKCTRCLHCVQLTMSKCVALRFKAQRKTIEHIQVGVMK